VAFAGREKPHLRGAQRFSAAIKRLSNELGAFIPCSAKVRFYAAGSDREKALRVMVFLQAYHSQPQLTRL
jgi:hypothetical protein